MKTTIKIIALVAVITAVLNACGKKNDKPFSTFKIDGVEYKTNNVRAVQGKAAAAFESADSVRFSFQFQSGAIPTSKPLRIIYWGEEPRFGIHEFYFIFKTNPPIGYALSPSDSTKILAATVDGVTTYTLEPSWFLREPDGEDSFLAEGVFVLPEVEKL